MRANATQSSPTAHPDTRVVIGVDTYASIDIGEEEARLVSYRLDEQSLGGQYLIEIDNDDSSLTTKEYEGQEVTVYFGFVGVTGSYLHKLIVEKQRFISEEGKLLMQLLCYDTLGKLSLFEGSVGGSIWNHPSQTTEALDQVVLPSGKGLPDALKTAINAQYDKTAWEIITAINTATIGVNITKDIVDDTALGLKPLVVAQDARSGILQALRNTSTYPRLKTNTADIDFVKPDAYGVVGEFYTSNLFFNDTDERAVVTPNKIVFHGISTDPETGERTLISTQSPHGEDADSIVLLGEIAEHNDYDPTSRENSTTQADVDAKAAARLAKLQLSKGTGTFVAPMHCSLELYDKIELRDTRYDPTLPYINYKTITGYVFRIIREYDRGIYRITVELGGVVTGYTPDRGSEAKINPTAPQLTPGNGMPFLPAYLPVVIDATFTPTDNDDIAWTSGTITTADGTTFSFDSGSLHLANSNFYYLYYELDNATLQNTQTFGDAVSAERILIAITLKASVAAQKALIIPAKGGKSPSINGDVICASAITAEKLSVTELAAITANMGLLNAGEIRLGTGTLGVDFTGWRLWVESSVGRMAGYNNNVLQWYSDTDGRLYAGAGGVSLGAGGAKFVGTTLLINKTLATNSGDLYSDAGDDVQLNSYLGAIEISSYQGNQEVYIQSGLDIILDPYGNDIIPGDATTDLGSAVDPYRECHALDFYGSYNSPQKVDKPIPKLKNLRTHTSKRTIDGLGEITYEGFSGESMPSEVVIPVTQKDEEKAEAHYQMRLRRRAKYLQQLVELKGQLKMGGKDESSITNKIAKIKKVLEREPEIIKREPQPSLSLCAQLGFIYSCLKELTEKVETLEQR